jgi:trk system potassium uptake protein
MDLMGNFQSLAGYQSDAVMLLTTAGLVIVGSTGYVVIMDLFRHRRFVKLSLDSKIVLVTTFVLLVIGTLFYLGLEYSNAATLGPLSFPQKMLGAFFQSVSPRTAGFTSIDIGSLSQIALLFTMVLMFIGGAAGSTAGGVKVNTLGVLWITILNIVKGRGNVEAFGRQISQRIINRSLVLFTIYLIMASLVVLALSFTETFPIENIMFEALSALSTVGLSTGITPDLSIAGRIIIIATMFIGRLGPLALMAFLVRRQQVSEIDYPHESVRLG